MNLVRHESPSLTPGLLILTAVAAAAFLVGGPTISSAQERQFPDTYTATTINMSPDGVELKADVLRWSSDDEREAAVVALGAEDPVAALRELPTLGVVWRIGSAVGHSIKYAYRETNDDGGETLTFVTDNAIGASSFSPWAADDPMTDVELGYSVIAMTTNGDGTMSLAVPVVIDEDANLVSLDQGEGPAILANVTQEPKPYWADPSD